MHFQLNTPYKQDVDTVLQAYASQSALRIQRLTDNKKATSCSTIGPPFTDLRQRSSSLHSMHSMHSHSNVCKAQNTLPDAQGMHFMLTNVQPPYLAAICLCQDYTMR